MADITLDVRGFLPAERHPKIHTVFDDFDADESLAILNNHDSKPPFYGMQAEVDVFDAGSYTVEQRASDEFAAAFPKR